jgi:hypothetical protein
MFSLYVNDIPTSSRHVLLAQYAGDTALAATFCIPLLLVAYLEASLGRLERWLRDWRNVINVCKSAGVLFIKAVRRIQKPRAVQFLGEPIQWVETARYLWGTLDAQLTWSAHVNQVGKTTAQRLGLLGPLRNIRSGLAVRNVVLLYKQLIYAMLDYACPIWRSAAPSHVRKMQVFSHCD